MKLRLLSPTCPFLLVLPLRCPWSYYLSCSTHPPLGQAQRLPPQWPSRLQRLPPHPHSPSTPLPSYLPPICIFNITSLLKSQWWQPTAHRESSLQSGIINLLLPTPLPSESFSKGLPASPGHTMRVHDALRPRHTMPHHTMQARGRPQLPSAGTSPRPVGYNRN